MTEYILRENSLQLDGSLIYAVLRLKIEVNCYSLSPEHDLLSLDPLSREEIVKQYNQL